MLDLKERYQILESTLGPMISESRSSVYDVMEMEAKGYDAAEIATIFNLTVLQVETALDYIEEHREQLTPILVELLTKKQEREAYHRRVQERVQAEIAQLPMTPERKAFYDLLEKNRARRREENGHDHPIE